MHYTITLKLCFSSLKHYLPSVTLFHAWKQLEDAELSGKYFYKLLAILRMLKYGDNADVH